ncbi:hypothetical protein ACFVAE_04650 [Microbacterium sp. NPDC057659]|uniref:hypothetical protein n=1 Tax=Microbacterium sp. NPDC057659 TaxID=3346198 RepID=UPI00366C9044
MRRHTLALVAVTALLLTGCSASVAPPAEDAASRPVIATTFPDLPAPSGEPELASLQDLHPAPGRVPLAAGPFDDRFVVRDVAFDGAVVTGELEITSDVSDVLELMVVAGFYDDGGRMLGTARFEQHADGDHDHAGVPSETIAFRIEVPAGLRGKAVAAAIGVPVLVNE